MLPAGRRQQLRTLSANESQPQVSATTSLDGKSPAHTLRLVRLRRADNHEERAVVTGAASSARVCAGLSERPNCRRKIFQSQGVGVRGPVVGRFAEDTQRVRSEVRRLAFAQRRALPTHSRNPGGSRRLLSTAVRSPKQGEQELEELCRNWGHCTEQGPDETAPTKENRAQAQCPLPRRGPLTRRARHELLASSIRNRQMQYVQCSESPHRPR